MWCDLPEGFATGTLHPQQFRRWSDSGVCNVTWEASAGSEASDAVPQMIDVMIIRAHHCAAGGKGAPKRTRSSFGAGGFSTKIKRRHQCAGLTDRPTVIMLGESHDVTGASGVAMQAKIHCDPEQMLGEKGYDSEAGPETTLRKCVGEAGSSALQPGKKHAVDKALDALLSDRGALQPRAKNLCRGRRGRES